MLTLWPLSVTHTCYRTSSSLLSKVFQWTKSLQVTQQKLQWTFCAHFFLDISFPDMATSNGQQDHPTYRCVIFTCGATLRVWCILHHHLAQLKNWSCGYRKRFKESRSTCYVGPWVVFTIGLLSVSSVMDGHLEDLIFQVEWCVVFFMFYDMFQDHWFTYFCKC